MTSFRQYLLETSFRDELNVPQNPVWHNEGGVARHSLMVRSAMDKAINMMKEKKENDPDGPLSLLDLDLSTTDVNLLRLSSLLHDIGKKNALDPVKLSAYGHEQPHMFEPAMARLGPVWQTIFKNLTPDEKDDLWFIISRHMSLDDEKGMSKSLWRQIVDGNGKYKNERKVKLLLAIFLMDRMGRGGGPRSRAEAKKFVQSNDGPGHKGMSGIYTTSDVAKKQFDKERAHLKPSAPSSPAEFVKLLRSNNQPDNVIKNALRRKRPDLSDEEIDSFL